MASRKHNISWVLIVSFICSFLFSASRASILDRKEFIVYMGDGPKDAILASNLYKTMVKTVLGSLANNSIMYEYTRGFSGFVVKLNRIEEKIMRKMKGVVSVFANEKQQMHTTRSWDFMGLPLTSGRTPMESDIIVGVLDSGVWPESASFNDIGMGPPPAKWKGSCGPFVNFNCNNKVIGAKFFKVDNTFGPDDVQSPRDTYGHGTHTASTAAGSIVPTASLYGFGLGTARGGVPSARIAVYKVCWILGGCSDADILAAFENAIADGVDIISLSAGPPTARPYFSDASAIGAFHAMKNGILTSISAGNTGPTFYTTPNVAPWFITVAASTIDRSFSTKVLLGNNQVYEGSSINTIDISNSMYPLVYGGNIPNLAGGYDSSTSRFCSTGSLNGAAVTGNILLCDNAETTVETVFFNGGAGAIMADSGPKDRPFPYPLPAARVETQIGSNILQYTQLMSNPTATIMKSTEGGDPFAPYVASFSSRGPNSITFDIIKPDITAPGVSILAAWSPLGLISGVKGDTRSVSYQIDSGTSMSCPHITGIAAYIKSFNPTWSPAAIKSAIMTTSMAMTGTGKNLESLEFAYGSGHVDPIPAFNPGLVYDADMISYVRFLCGQGYTDAALQLVTGEPTFVCIPGTGSFAWDLNYPSFGYSTPVNFGLSRTFIRTLTNVGPAISTYIATVNLLPGLIYLIEPAILPFTFVGQRLSFTLTIQGSIAPLKMHSGSLVWYDGVHKVRSPIVIFVP